MIEPVVVFSGYYGAAHVVGIPGLPWEPVLNAYAWCGHFVCTLVPYPLEMWASLAPLTTCGGCRRSTRWQYDGLLDVRDGWLPTAGSA